MTIGQWTSFSFLKCNFGDETHVLPAFYFATSARWPSSYDCDDGIHPQEIIGLGTSNSSRRLRRLAAPAGPTVVITIKARSPEEAAETASDMDAARLHPAASRVLQGAHLKMVI